jgi:hypothetical protein
MSFVDTLIPDVTTDLFGIREMQARARTLHNEQTMNKVRAGATVLDRTSPGWFRVVSLGRLDIKSLKNCVLGQVYGDYMDGLMVVFGRMHQQEATDHGFDALGSEAARIVEGTWKDEIMKRRASARLA